MVKQSETVFKIPTKQWTQNLDHKFKILLFRCMHDLFSMICACIFRKVSYHQVIKLHIFLYFSFQLGKLYSCWKMSSTVWRPLECFQEILGNIYQIIYYLETVWKISWSDDRRCLCIFVLVPSPREL